MTPPKSPANPNPLETSVPTLAGREALNLLKEAGVSTAEFASKVGDKLTTKLADMVGWDRNAFDLTNFPHRLFNIIGDYPWTVTNLPNRENVPSILLTEYELNNSFLVASLRYWIMQLATDAADPYYGIYDASPTGTSYILPYYESYHHAIRNNWSPRESVIDEYAKTAAETAELLIAPHGGITSPEIWKGSEVGEYEVTFRLYNTINPAKDIRLNNSFIQRLIFGSLPNKKSAIVTWPPALYKVNIPGIRFSPVAVMSRVAIDHIGHMGVIGGKIIPDAWQIKITLRELIPESRQIYSAVWGGQEPNAMVALAEDWEKIKSSIQETLQKIQQDYQAEQFTQNAVRTTGGSSNAGGGVA